MNRALIGIPTGPPDRDQILMGATPVDPGYPKPYRPDDFRSWAADVDEIHQLMAADLTGDRLRHQLEQRPQLAQTYGRMFTDDTDGVKGEVVRVGNELRVNLDGGRHRAHYQMERGYSYTPVWVRADDPRDLDELRASCSSAMRSADPHLAEAYDRQPADQRTDRGRTIEGLEARVSRGRVFERGEFER